MDPSQRASMADETEAATEVSLPQTLPTIDTHAGLSLRMRNLEAQLNALSSRVTAHDELVAKASAKAPGGLLSAILGS